MLFLSLFVEEVAEAGVKRGTRFRRARQKDLAKPNHERGHF